MGARPNIAASSMFSSEEQVMDLWDGGKTIEEIAELTGHKRHYVRTIVSRFTDTSHTAFDRMSIAGTTALLEAIARHHPERVTGSRAA